jgi:hypothetical protein
MFLVIEMLISNSASTFIQNVHHTLLKKGKCNEKGKWGFSPWNCLKIKNLFCSCCFIISRMCFILNYMWALRSCYTCPHLELDLQKPSSVLLALYFQVPTQLSIVKSQGCLHQSLPLHSYKGGGITMGPTILRPKKHEVSNNLTKMITL